MLRRLPFFSSFMDLAGNQTFVFPSYGKGHCPDSLAWSDEEEMCLLRCLYNYYSEDQLLAVSVVTKILAVISFLLCYFFCFTALFRPVMRSFPNSNIFFLHFSFMIASSSVLLPLILGDRYVYCDSNTEPGSENWACVFSGLWLLCTGFMYLLSYQLSYYITGSHQRIRGSPYFTSLRS